MERAKAKAVLEAILFTMGDSVSVDSLSTVIEEDKAVTKELLEEMAQDYSAQDRGIGLTTLNDAVQMCTKGELYEYLIRIAKAPKICADGHSSGNTFHYRLQAAGYQA